MAEYVDEFGVIHNDSEGTRQEHASKASFKLDLIETVNADPVLEPSDLKLMTAYAAVLQWPKREAWLSISRARAMTGLSERQISNSRARLAGKNNAKRTYLALVRRQGSTPVYRIENPWWEDSRQHVAIQTEYYREAMRERQAARRRHVSAKSAVTEPCLSQSPSECDVSATVAGNIPAHTPQDLALSKEASTGTFSIDDYAVDSNAPFEAPASVEDSRKFLMRIGVPSHRLETAMQRHMREALLPSDVLLWKQEARNGQTA